MHMMVVTCSEIEEMLTKWRDGAISEREIHSWAEDRFNTHRFDVETDAANAVLRELDQMNMNLLMRQDASILLEALRSPRYEQLIEQLTNNIDVQQRRRLLKDHPFYRPFCK